MRRLLIVALAAWPAIAGAQATQPGNWTIDTTITSVDMPGAPPAMVARLKGHKTHASRCLSAAEAARGPQEVVRDAKGCKMIRYDRKAGKLDAQMVCKDAQGTLTTTSTGTFTSSSYNTTAKMVRTGGQRMSMTMESVGKRTGSCSK
jgi:hypothetical protein